MKNHQVAFRVDDEMHARICYAAARRNLKLQEFLIQAVEQFIDSGPREPANIPKGVPYGAVRTVRVGSERFRITVRPPFTLPKGGEKQ